MSKDSANGAHEGSGSGSSSQSSGATSSTSGENRSNRQHQLEVEKAMEVQTIGPFLDHGGCELRLVNVTATANMGCTIDLKTVVMRARNAEYNPKRFSACVSACCLRRCVLWVHSST